MKIEEAYLAVSGYFDLWVRIMELQTRMMEVQDSGIKDSRILIISPPTDRGIKVLAQANPRGETHLLCFSEALGHIARKYSIQGNIQGLQICVQPFFSIPFAENYFDAVFANCFFDFCQEGDFNDILQEIKRTLKIGGLFFSVYMNAPPDSIGRIWGKVFDKFQSLSRGCHPVDIIPYLSKWGFKLKKELTIRRFGFPLKYLFAEG